MVLALSVEILGVHNYVLVVLEETSGNVDVCWSIFLIPGVERGERFCLIRDVWMLLERSK